MKDNGNRCQHEFYGQIATLRESGYNGGNWHHGADVSMTH